VKGEYEFGFPNFPSYNSLKDTSQLSIKITIALRFIKNRLSCALLLCCVVLLLSKVIQLSRQAVICIYSLILAKCRQKKASKTLFSTHWLKFIANYRIL